MSNRPEPTNRFIRAINSVDIDDDFFWVLVWSVISTAAVIIVSLVVYYHIAFLEHRDQLIREGYDAMDLRCMDGGQADDAVCIAHVLSKKDVRP